MEEASSKNIRLGIFITIGFLLIIGLIYFLGSQRSLFGSKVEVEVLFNTVSGLQPGASVRLSGLNIGTVKGVSIANDSMVSVTMLIDDQAARYVKNDAYASIESDGLMGSKIVTIFGGSSGQYISDGDRINGKEPLSIDDVVTSFKNASDNANKLTSNLVVISDQIRNGDGLLGRLVSDTVMALRVERIVASLEASGNHAARITTEIEKATRSINEGEGLVASLLYNRSWTRTASSVMDSITSTADNLSLASENLRDFSEKLNDNRGAIDKLMDDPAVAKDVEATIYNLNKGTANIDDVLETINDSWILNLFSGKDEKTSKQEK